MNASLRRGTSGDEIHSARIGIAIVLLLVLAGCGTLPPRGPGGEPATPVETAESLSMQGRHEASADLYQQMARQAGAVPRQRYLILTARERHLAGTPEVARTILNRLSLPIDASNRLLWAQVSAEVAISMGNPARALANLDSAPPAETAADATNILLIRGHALFRLGQPVAATAALLEREVWLEKKSAIAANQRLLWEGYRTWGVRSVAGDAIPGDDPIMRGWLALGEIAWTRRTEPAAMRRALLSWRDDYPNHPANRLLIRELISGLPAAQAFPRRVALLLPLTGQARQAAAAIRDGFLAAHFSATELPDRPAIRIYDVSSLGVAQAYRQAVDEGATFVVGPLMKTAVRELSAVGVTTPTLTLNFLPDDAPAPAGLYQFSLSPEDEARHAERR
ncbi:MAG: penicillin-binding protein activator, partial [Paracoccaceae bacterium]